ncbi:hypothetical protein REPUB_Repub14bG0106000 [Reevesia pubescens]
MLSDNQNSITRPHCYNHKRRFAGKNINSVTIIASINKSIVKCRHHLTKFLSELARIVTPSCRFKGFEILKQEDQKTQFEANNVVVGSCPESLEPEFETFSFNIVPQPPVLVLHNNLLPPLDSDKKGTIVLDLDETLVHSCLDPPPPWYDFSVSRIMDGETINFYVLKRPGVDEFLEMISKKYEVVVFTAGHKAYASKVLDTLDPKGFISHRFYRDSCKQVRGKFMKDLSELGRDLRKIVIIDDNPKSFALQPENGIPIKPFYGDELWDRELMKLAGFFERCDVFQDMRDAINHYLGDEHHDQFLPPLVSNSKRTIVLDLDETLVHSSPEPPPPTYDFKIKPRIDGVIMNFYVLKRPGVDEFLETISKNYEVVVFTAGLEPYAPLVLDILDPEGLKRPWKRCDCL